MCEKHSLEDDTNPSARRDESKRRRNTPKAPPLGSNEVLFWRRELEVCAEELFFLAWLIWLYVSDIYESNMRY